jgi:hypothetical protein
MASTHNDKPLPKRLQPALKALEKDLLERAKIPSVEAGLRAAWEAEKKAARPARASIRGAERGSPRSPWPGRCRWSSCAPSKTAASSTRASPAPTRAVSPARVTARLPSCRSHPSSGRASTCWPCSRS